MNPAKNAKSVDEVKTITYTVTVPAPLPEKLHHCCEVFGLLQSIRLAEDCQIAQIDQLLIVLPPDLDLAKYVGQMAGIVNVDGKYHVRGLA
jgi:hypothetical protein